jgi:hypothetical protein
MINFYETIDKKFLDPSPPNPNFDLHGFKLPFRACVVAPSGSGKTNMITGLIHLFCKGKGSFNTITVICRDATEPLYRHLASKSDSIMIREGLENLPVLDKFEKEHSSLVIIDDMVLDKNQSRICEYYIRCRKRNVSIMYLSQSYFMIPKIIRNNCNYLILLKMSGDREVNLIMKESGLGLSKQQLLGLYEFATDTKFSPLIINIEETDKQKKFRKGFTEFINPDDFK